VLHGHLRLLVHLYIKKDTLLFRIGMALFRIFRALFSKHTGHFFQNIQGSFQNTQTSFQKMPDRRELLHVGALLFSHTQVFLKGLFCRALFINHFFFQGLFCEDFLDGALLFFHAQV